MYCIQDFLKGGEGGVIYVGMFNVINSNQKGVDVWKAGGGGEF